MTEFAMDGKELILPECPGHRKENCSMLNKGETFSSPDSQSSDDGRCNVVSSGGAEYKKDGSEYKKDAAVCSVCSLSPSKEAPSDDYWMGSASSPYSMDSKKNKFGFQTPGSQSHNTHTEDECASLILTCLFCQFYDFLLMLPHTCAHLWTRTCCYECHKYSTDTSNSSCDCNSKCEFDCGLFDACQETSECLELALEISEVCYR
ncbi:myoD family inhibitor domain-containing protein 2 [Rhinoraja longicauda]